MLTRVLAIASVALATVPSAMAADLPGPASPPAFTWTGFYLGVNGGYITKHDRLDGTVPDLNAVLPGAANVIVRQFSDSGAGGGQIGYAYQFGAGRGLVVGVEADLAYTGLNRTNMLALPPGVPVQASYTSRLKELGTVRGRVGYAFGRLLAYATGGFACGEALRTSRLNAGGASLAQVVVDDLEMGYAVGGGLEYALPRSGLLTSLPGTVTLRGEYLRYDLTQQGDPLSLLGQDTAIRMRSRGDLGRAAVNYRF